MVVGQINRLIGYIFGTETVTTRVTRVVKQCGHLVAIEREHAWCGTVVRGVSPPGVAVACPEKVLLHLYFSRRVRPKLVSAEYSAEYLNRIFCRNRIVVNWHY